MQAQEKSACTQWNCYFPSARSLQLICTSMTIGPKIFYGTVFCTQYNLKGFKMSLQLNYIFFQLESECTLILYTLNKKPMLVTTLCAYKTSVCLGLHMQPVSGYLEVYMFK